MEKKEAQKSFPFVKMAVKMGSAPIHLKVQYEYVLREITLPLKYWQAMKGKHLQSDASKFLPTRVNPSFEEDKQEELFC